MSPRRSKRSKITATSISYREGNESSSAGEDSDYDYQPNLFGNILGLFMQNMMQQVSGGRRRRQPKKRTPAKRRRTAGPCCGQDHCAANMFGRQNRRTDFPAAGTSGLGGRGRRGGRGKKTKNDASTAAPVLSLDSDDDVKITDTQKKGITSKIDSFFKEVESSDDDFENKFKKHNEQEKPATLTKNSDFYTISDDDADDVKLVSSCEGSFSQPSTSGIDSLSLNLTREEVKEKNKEDLFAFVDDIINNCDVQFEDPKPKNGPVETLEDLKKKTEELLGSVSTLIDEFNPNKMSEKPKPTDEPQEAPSCPVCFEQFGEKLQRMVTMCGHLFCEPCISEVARTIKKCPTCRKSVTIKKYHAIYI